MHVSGEVITADRGKRTEVFKLQRDNIRFKLFQSAACVRLLCVQCRVFFRRIFILSPDLTACDRQSLRASITLMP